MSPGHFVTRTTTGTVTQFDVDKYVPMIFIEPIGTFGMPRPMTSIAPIRWIGKVIAKVVPAIIASHNRLSFGCLRDSHWYCDQCLDEASHSHLAVRDVARQILYSEA
jgi:hypothetical protein